MALSRHLVALSCDLNQILSALPSHSVNKDIFFLLELVENCIFEAAPVKKALSHILHFLSCHPNRFKGKVVQSFEASYAVLFHILERVFYGGVAYYSMAAFLVVSFIRHHIKIDFFYEGFSRDLKMNFCCAVNTKRQDLGQL